MNDWPAIPIEKLAAKSRGALATGPFGSAIGSRTFSTAGIPVIRGGNLSADVGVRLAEEGLVYVDEALARSFERSTAIRGDLIFTCWGTVNQVGIIDERAKHEKYVVSNKQMKLTVDRSLIDPLYLYYYFSSPYGQSDIESRAIGSSVPGFNLTQLRSIPIRTPPLVLQQDIVRVLSALDDKIELNRRVNKTLEGMAQAIFRDWFVDFGPVRRKLAGATDPIEIMGGLIPDPAQAAQLAERFPNELGEEGLPKGWAASTVGDCFSLTMGQSPPGDTYNDAGIGLPFFQGRTDFGFRFPENRKYCSKPNRLAQANDTLISVRAPVGDLNMAWERCCIGRGVAAARHLSGAKAYTYCALRSLQPELEQFEHTGTVFGAINKKQFERLSVVEPSARAIAAFEELIGPLDDRIRTATTESRTLAETRDYLLPRLMSGAVRVGDLEIRA